MPLSPDDPASLPPAQRRQEIAAILGRGVLRCCSACTSALASQDEAAEPAGHKALDVSAPGDPHVSWLTQLRT